jgi:predicted ribosome quality control (RQC) complex YloA/Tae2 family protein
MSLDGLSMSPLVTELNNQLTGCRIDRIFQTDPYALLIWVRQLGANLRLLISAHPEHARIHLTEDSPPNPPSPPAFCMLLRKHLEDARISAVRQHGLDRIIIIDVDVRGEHGLIVTKHLSVELMGKHSNIILTQEGFIIDAIRRIGPSQSRHRHVLPGRSYMNPPGQDRLNPLQVEAAYFMETLQKKTGIITKAIMSTGLGIGPVSAKEMAYRAQIPFETPVETINQSAIVRLQTALNQIIAPIKSECPHPTVVLAEDKHLLAVAAFPLEHLAGKETLRFSTMSQASEFADKLKGVRQPPEKQLLVKLVQSELAKLQRKRNVLTQELTDASGAESYRYKADILMAYLNDIVEGSSEVTLPDFYSEDMDTKITISLDPLLSPIGNANSYYHKYGKLKRAQDSLAIQIAQTEDEISYLEGIGLALEYAQAAEDISDIRYELIAAGYLKEMNKRRPPQALSSPLTFASADGFTVLVGKNNRQNDVLTMKQAQPDDVWLHTKNIPGSHVLIRTGGREPSPMALELAAQLAAYYSKARQSAKVPVDYTKRRYVRKPSGAKPGFVIYDRQNTIYITPDETYIQSLLKK